MKKYILYILTFIYTFLKRNCRIKKSVYILNKTQIKGHNQMRISNSYMSRLKILLEGENNQIINKGSTLIRGELRVHGNNNTILIKQDCNLANIRIVVRGNNCRVVIGNDVTCGSAYIACMGVANEVIIGDDCMLAENIDIWATDSHAIYDYNQNIINPSKSIYIGNHVWIGKGSSILKGVTIGDGAIIGMKSMVTKDIARNSLNVGAPTKTIKTDIHWKREFITI